MKKRQLQDQIDALRHQVDSLNSKCEWLMYVFDIPEPTTIDIMSMTIQKRSGKIVGNVMKNNTLLQAIADPTGYQDWR